MSKRYTQLTEAERYHIYTMKKQGYTDTVIAQGMGSGPHDHLAGVTTQHRSTRLPSSTGAALGRGTSPDEAQAGQADA